MSKNILKGRTHITTQSGVRVKLSGVKEVAVDSLTKNDQQDRLYASLSAENRLNMTENIKRNGLLNPILIRDGKTVVDGHQRLFCVRQLKWETVPCIEILEPSPLPDDIEREIMMSCNEIRRGGTWDVKFRQEFYRDHPEIWAALTKKNPGGGRATATNGRIVGGLARLIVKVSNGRINIHTANNDIQSIRRIHQPKKPAYRFGIEARSLDKKKCEVKIRCLNIETAQAVEQAINKLETAQSKRGAQE